MHLLGGIDQHKEKCEGTGNLGSSFQRQSPHFGNEIIKTRCVRLLKPSRPTGNPQLFNSLETLLPFEAADHIS
jgi:hypothetical protein